MKGTLKYSENFGIWSFVINAPNVELNLIKYVPINTTHIQFIINPYLRPLSHPQICQTHTQEKKKKGKRQDLNTTFKHRAKKPTANNKEEILANQILFGWHLIFPVQRSRIGLTVQQV